MLSGMSVSVTCRPAGVSVQPLGRRKPLSVWPAYCGWSPAAGDHAVRPASKGAAAKLLYRGIERLQGLLPEQGQG